MSDATPSPGTGSDGERGWRAANARLTRTNRLVLAAVALALAAGAAVLLIDEGEDADREQTPSVLAGSSVLASAGDTGSPNAPCSAWSPERIADSAVALEGSGLYDYQTVAEPGLAQFVRALGVPGGYATLSEADGVAIAGVGLQAGAATSAYRWIVIRSGDRFYPLVAVLYDPVLFETGSIEPITNPEPPPCVVGPESAEVKAWHALNHLGVYPNNAWIRWDQNDETLPAGGPYRYPPDQPPLYTGKAPPASSSGGSFQRVGGRDVGGGPTARSLLRIVGGTTVDIADFPWQVALFKLGETAADTKVCGGTLLTSTIVLTAAHCVTDTNGGFTIPLSNFVVVSGSSKPVTEGTASDLKEIWAFTDNQNRPLYDPRNVAWDVAILELEDAADGEPLKLAGENEARTWAAGTSARVSGWGSTTISSAGADVSQLRAATVEILGDAECQTGFTLDETSLCAGNPPGGASTCGGDSGGPLVVGLADGDNRLVGATSYGPNACGSAPVVYAQVADDPIRSKVQDLVLELEDVDVVGSGGEPAQPPPPSG